MYITITDIIGEKTIDPSYPICSSKETPDGPAPRKWQLSEC